jgi:hypothetical protein
MLALEPAGGQLRRAAALEVIEDGFAQLGLAFETRPRPAPRSGLLVGIGRLIAELAAAVAVQLTSDRRWRAIQSCRNLPDRAPFGLKAGYRAPVFQ